MKTDNTENNVEKLKKEVEYGLALREITNRIHSAKNINEILVDLKDDMLGLFDADRITIYAVDGVKKELYSRFMVGNGIKEIRVPVSPESIAGYTAHSKELVNISNAYDTEQLKSINPSLRFDKSWDQKTGYKTVQVLAAPIIFERYLLGVIQLINKKDGTDFTVENQISITEIAKILGIAFYNQIKMSKRRPSKFDYLVTNHIITSRELEEAIKDAREQREEIESILMKRFKISKSDIGKALSDFYKCRFVQFDDKTVIPGELLVGLKVSYLKKTLWVPLEKKGDKIVIVIDNPADLQRTDFIKAKFGKRDCEFVVALKGDIISYLTLFFGEEVSRESISDLLNKLDDEDDVSEFDTLDQQVSEDDSVIVQLVNKIITEAYNRDASDIHVETYPGKSNTEIRLRIDGMCVPYQTIPYSHKMAVVSRIKIMSQLDIAERRLPQDGKIKFKIRGGREIELRVATLPTSGGTEDVVMRILAASEPIPLDKLAMSDRNLNLFKEIVQKPYGIVMVVGPTGSGKTTTLHSALGFINTPEKKIWTAEDPVEITQYRLRQVQVRPKIGLNFAVAMRAFLRADPDVIMVGEMRDEETVSTGIEASLTGHLVFSTLHTNSAPETITRLLDMGMDPFNFADALLGVLAQRLLRTLCKECKKPYNPSEEEFKNLVMEYGEEYFKDLDISYSQDMIFYSPVGCPVCNNTGYKGRMGIHELLIASDEIKALIQNKARVEEIREQAMKECMRTLKQDGIEKAIKGYTDVKQVRAVCIK
ncbi:MAG: pilus assembly protein [Deltaproteobacteria bacterium CG_4_9_14_3_um_filter_44_9]|nr:MAG: pilus assembly protein [Deltaproteobacteria bacterium CG06_land_8_20_14_3_00_44_19]PIX23417.1 MAG: pilus assembly protein [Deltaproteobacteria bacterium CG_4_8_14_3_um_filter_43_13]PIZ21245.1 MAG: pilus assembly protein [Deltaproteobacteria bacterium CG_4_10_14_0_8_um_filter_43_12]PJB38223.1 MAG: pilus assembly protein [Deltaproteobacteria bacterium CG_4_9_14_3_um_filter_44_9]